MKKGLLNRDEIRHLDHRWCVLVSFLDVVDYRTKIGHSREGRIYRGCLDGAIATCRALCERFSISVNSKGWKQHQPCNPRFVTKIREILPSATEEKCGSLWKVLVAANRCVCHLEGRLVEHQVNHTIMAEAISLVQEIVRVELKRAQLESRICI